MLEPPSSGRRCVVESHSGVAQVLVRSEQCFDDLLVAMLELILRLPRQMRKLSVQIPALKQALKHGVSYVYIARVGLDCLEEWVDDRSTHLDLQWYMRDILPLLELYFRQQEEGESSQKGALSIDKKIGKYRYAIKKKARAPVVGGENAGGGGGGGTNELKDVAIKAVKLLGKLGTDETWLAGAAEQEAFEDR